MFFQKSSIVDVRLSYKYTNVQNDEVSVNVSIFDESNDFSAFIQIIFTPCRVLYQILLLDGLYLRPIKLETGYDHETIYL